MKSVSVDKNKCVACGACLSCTEYFYDGEDGLTNILGNLIVFYGRNFLS